MANHNHRSFKILKRNQFFYDHFLRTKIQQVRDQLSPQELLTRIAFLARFSWRNHSGYYFDGRVENILVDFGSKLEAHIDGNEANQAIDYPAGRKSFAILYVASQLGIVGGHTRMLYQFLKRHNCGNRVLVLTDQRVEDIPLWFARGLAGDVPIVSLADGASVFDRAYKLRNIASSAQKVILYHHPFDVVPIMAFSHPGGPPVLIDNHAHSWFWLGASVGDLVFTHSNFHKDFTMKTRPIRNVHFLRSTDIDDLDGSFAWKDKDKAKDRLGISRETICLITVGTAEKFVPNADYDFFRTSVKILTRFQNAHIFVAGISDIPSSVNGYHFNKDRIHLLGSVDDLTDYYRAADIYLEAMPQPSGGATLASGPIGLCCPLLKYGQGNVFKTSSVIDSTLYEKYIGNPENEEKYLDALEFLLCNQHIRAQIAQEIRENYLRKYSADVLAIEMKHMLKTTDGITHSARRIPDGECHCDSDSIETAGTSALQDLRNVLAYFGRYLDWKDKTMILLRLIVKPLFFTHAFKAMWSLSINKIKHSYSASEIFKRLVCTD